MKRILNYLLVGTMLFGNPSVFYGQGNLKEGDVYLKLKKESSVVGIAGKDPRGIFYTELVDSDGDLSFDYAQIISRKDTTKISKENLEKMLGQEEMKRKNDSFKEVLIENIVLPVKE